MKPHSTAHPQGAVRAICQETVERRGGHKEPPPQDEYFSCVTSKFRACQGRRNGLVYPQHLGVMCSSVTPSLHGFTTPGCHSSPLGILHVDPFGASHARAQSELKPHHP